MRVSAIEGHRIWSATYDTDPNPLLALDMRVLSQQLGSLRDLRLVDIACGTGRWMRFAQWQGANVTGVDLCPEMLSVAARKHELAGRLILADAGRLPLASGSADLCLCSFALSYFQSPERALMEMARITRRGGCVVVSDLHPEAAPAGWKRSFRAGSCVFEIDSHPPSIRRLQIAAEQYGLLLDLETAAHFGHPEREIFERAGKESVFFEATRVPALWLLRWTKL